MDGLTPIQAKCLDVIRRRTTDAMSPSFAEIGMEVGLSTRSAVLRVVRRLEERGYVSFSPRQARSIRLIPQTPSEAVVEAVHVLCAQAAGECSVPTYDAIRETLADAMERRA